MKAFKTYAVPIGVGLLAFFTLEFLFPVSPSSEIRSLNCVFRSETNSSPANFPTSSEQISEVTFAGELSGKSVHDDTELWTAEGTAVFRGTSQNLRGPVFILTSTGKIRGLSLYRDRYPHQMIDVRISTLDDSGRLDWNEDSAFVYFEGAPDKMAHLYDYSCTIEEA